MPNHVLNEVIFRGLTAEQQDAIVAAVSGPGGKIDFEALVPSPLNIWPGSVGTKHEKAFPDTHLDWARKNWGTKWNAYGARTVTREGPTLTLVFETAWAPPYGWLVAIFNAFKIDFEHNWLSEGRDRTVRGVWNYARLDDMGGEAWDETEADEATHRRIHKMHWGVEEFNPEGDAA